MRDYEFWPLTLRQFDALSKRLERKQKDRSYEIALLLQMIYNRTIQNPKKERAKKVEDFLGKEELTQEDFDRKVLTSFHYIKAIANATK